jgi:hypothetical protein
VVVIADFAILCDELQALLDGRRVDYPVGGIAGK